MVPIVQEAGWAPGPVWTVAENLAPTGIQSRNVQPVASRYTDYATRPTLNSDSRQGKKRVNANLSAISTVYVNNQPEREIKLEF
jgi:hypothetical protein